MSEPHSAISSEQSAEQRALDSLIDRIDEHVRLEKLTDRQLVFEAAHSEAADIPIVEEMMSRLFPDWTEVECPPDCWACKQEMSRG